jgi:hypothetical protein
MPSQTEPVPPLTPRLLEIVGHTERAALLYRLLHGEATAKQLRTPAATATEGNPYLRRALDQSAGSRFLTRFTDVGLAEQVSQPKTYRLTCPGETRELLEAANRLALAIGRAAESGDRSIDDNLRRTRFSAAKQA